MRIILHRNRIGATPEETTTDVTTTSTPAEVIINTTITDMTPALQIRIPLKGTTRMFFAKNGGTGCQNR